MVDEGRPGSIMAVTSIEGVRAAPGFAAYAAAKAGVINFTKTAALELAPHGIRVNALAPDITLTEGILAMAPDGSPGALRRQRAHGSAPATWTRWPGPRCSWPRTCRATSPARPSTWTAAPTRPAAGTTHPDTGEYILGPTG